ncbi:exosortase V [Gimibacter soli]|uniref:Exosortase n=1 Tax=Gimibacter soli TaxID=3024400 RepID=A0AAE9XLK9_9PROT|nr:exosortase V [Gimibacter soli]WCL53172.1 exosortase [Gimibacter soli]
MTTQARKPTIDLDLQRIASDLFGSGMWLVVTALVVTYFSTYAIMAEGPWNTDQDGHGPFILIVAFLAFLIRYPAIAVLPKPDRIVWEGWALLVVSLAVFAVGSSQEILLFDSGSQIPVAASLILIFRGWAGLKAAWFPIFFLVFSIPLPGWLIDGATLPLKVMLSDQVVELLYNAGYEIAQNGVILYIGQYQLLVKDACVGLNSMHSLAAVGVLYIYLIKPQNWMHTALLVLFILPAAYAANVLRVIILVLITFYLGDEAGQGFLHDFAGIVMFASALLLFFVFDNLIFGGLRWIQSRKKAA